MLFNSSIYIFCFLPLVVTGYFLLNRQRYILAAVALVVLGSLFFYRYWYADYLYLLMSSILVNYSFGAMLQQGGKRQRKQGSEKLSRSLLLAVGILFNLGLLGYFKYTDFFLVNVNYLFDQHFSLPHLTLPLAISFFTFQQIAYLVDCSRDNAGEYDFLHYCLFVSFFPQLIAGPIVHHQEMMPQFKRLRNKVFSWPHVALGTFFFSVGLFKKVWIADHFSIWVNRGFGAEADLTFFDAWGTSLSYTMQLYFDFSGYADMAIGSALFFNIVLPVNFNSPYKAASIQDFWRRWHMTLSRWLREYLYIPMGGNRGGGLRTLFNLFVTFLLAGLWHGAGWTFVVWGVLHGLALVVHRLWQKVPFRLPVMLGWMFTFLFVNMAWVVFRANDLGNALDVLKGMAGLNGFALSPSLLKEFGGTGFIGQLVRSTGEGVMVQPKDMYLYILIFFLVALLLPNSCQLGGLLPDKKGQKQEGRQVRFFLRLRSAARRYYPASYPYAVWAVFSALLFSVSLYQLLRVTPTEFLYFNF